MLSQALGQLLIRKRISVKELDAFLYRHKLTMLLPSILEALKHEESRVHVRDMLVIETPFPLSKKALGSIVSRMDAEDAAHEVRINTNLLGGFKAIYKGNLLDQSIRTILNRFISH